MKKRDVTGLSIALVDDQRVVWPEGFGYADKAGNVPASPETVYRAGSISKLFTATAAMQLAEREKLDIDRPLGDYLPGFSIRTRFADSAPVTPRSIMTHHSGLPSDYLRGMWTRNPEPFTRVSDRLKDEYAANPPGTVFSYSNLGITLLGDAVGKVAGRDFASHLRDEILLPLGMSRSSFSPSADRTPLAAKGYRKGAEAEEPSLRDVPGGNRIRGEHAFLFRIFTEEKGQVVRERCISALLMTAA
jgi:CubicO group peptidase (beta-lactamase class C family)